MVSALLSIVERVAVVYAVVLIGLRVTGKREIGQMAPFDFVLLLLIANAVQNAMTGPDTSLLGGITAAVTLLAANFFIARFAVRYPRFRHFIEGRASILVRDGKILRENLLKEGISSDVLEQMLREHGTSAVADVKLAVLEIDGSVSVIRYDDSEHVIRHARHRFKVFQKR